MDLVKNNATGTAAFKATQSIADLASRDAGGAPQKKSLTDFAYFVAPTPARTSMADRSMADFVTGGLTAKTTLDMLAYRRTI